MSEFGQVVSEGTPGYATVRMGLRAPRVAVRVEVGQDWQSRFAVAMWAASQLWGGAGFIYVPVCDGAIDQVMRRVLRAYDPDYLVDLPLTIADMEAMHPGWLAERTPTIEVGSVEHRRALQASGDIDAGTGFGQALGADACSPYFDHFDLDNPGPRRVNLNGSDFGGPLATRVAVTGDSQLPAFKIPDGLDPTLKLALALRAGFASKPRLPLEAESSAGADPADRLPAEYVRYALATNRRRMPPVSNQLLSQSTAWDLSAKGLVSVGHMRPTPRQIAVVGSTPEDFALAAALDRMFGDVTWLPAEWLDQPTLESSLAYAWRTFRQDTFHRGTRSVLTSVSIDAADALSSLEKRWATPSVSIQVGEHFEPLPQPESSAVDPIRLDLTNPRHLACIGDYDITLTMPTRADGRGGLVTMHNLPIHVPSSPQLQSAMRPFWEVDVAVAGAAVPPARNVGAATFNAERGLFAGAPARSSRDGISFNSMSMAFVPSEATLRQATATITLNHPGLLAWIRAMLNRHAPDCSAELSDAGRRASTCARLWGSRSALADDLYTLDHFLRAFMADGRSISDVYPDRDGMVIPGLGGVLTLSAAERTMPSLEQVDVRSVVNRLLRRDVIRRGIVLRCQECERWDFYALDYAAEMNTCRRCSARVQTEDARLNTDIAEPAWFYDLHGAVRELIEQNGDVPLLAARVLAESAGLYADVPEIDFLTTDRNPQEIDLICIADDRLIVGEAKINASFGSRRERQSAVNKLIQAARLLAADEVVLATTALGPWKADDVALLRHQITRYEWPRGTGPSIRVLTGIRSASPINDLLT